MTKEQGIERKIVIGLIVSTPYIDRIRRIWSSKLLQSAVAKRIAVWCVDYYDKYGKAPGREIETIYFEKLKKGLPEDIAEEIEEDILPDLSEEYENSDINFEYLAEQTHEHFNEMHLKLHGEKIRGLLEQGEVEEAEKLANEYLPLPKDEGEGLNLGSDKALEELEKAFSEAYRPVVSYPKQLGDFLNRQLIHGGFVAFLAPEKRGKSYFLLDMAIRAAKQGKKAAFFQAGDMTLHQQMRRIGIYLCKKSDREEYCGKSYQPVRDCIYNQTNQCDKDIRECDFGVFDDRDPDELRQEITQEELIEAYKDEPDYRPCHNCSEYKYRPWGTPWVKEIPGTAPLQIKEARKAWARFFKGRNFMISTHANGTLSLQEIKAILNGWKRYDDFVPDIIVIDYADLLVNHNKVDYRHQQNEIWKGLRSLSQENNEPLVVTATQSDAASYEKKRLSLKNFSEDKRKYAHPTAVYGLNQDPQGREKRIGLMILNEMVLREGYFDATREVTVLQNLSRGLPIISSFW